MVFHGTLGFCKVEVKIRVLQACSITQIVVVIVVVVIVGGGGAAGVGEAVGGVADFGPAGGGIEFWGHSFAAGAQGELLASADDQETVLNVELDFDRIAAVRQIWPFFRDRRIDHYGDIVKRWRE